MTDETQAVVASVARQIRVELAARSMQHHDLAEAVPLSHSAMSHYLTAKRSIPMPTFIRIAEILEMEPSEILGRAAELPAERSPHDSGPPPR